MKIMVIIKGYTPHFIDVEIETQRCEVFLLKVS